MSEESARFVRIADGFGARAAGVRDWDASVPCAGWAARDVVRHVVEWVPGMFAAQGLAPVDVSVDDDPVAAWTSLRTGLQAILDDPDAATRTMQFGPAGEHTIPAAIDRFVTADLLVHTWDLARASGQDDTLDEEFSASLLAGFEAMGEALVASGHFGAAQPVDPSAPVHLRMIAASGRDPGWQP